MGFWITVFILLFSAGVVGMFFVFSVISSHFARVDKLKRRNKFLTRYCAELKHNCICMQVDNADETATYHNLTPIK